MADDDRFGNARPHRVSRARRDHRPVRDSSPASLNRSEQLLRLVGRGNAVVNGPRYCIGLNVRIVTRVVIVWIVVVGVYG